MKLLERLVSEYLEGLIEHNKIKFCYDAPIAVCFGEALPWSVVCASSQQLDKFNAMDRLDSDDFRDFVRLWALLTKSQYMLINATT